MNKVSRDCPWHFLGRIRPPPVAVGPQTLALAAPVQPLCRMRRSLLLLLVALGGGFPAWSSAAEALPARFQQVDIAPTWTSIYVGTVSLKMPTLVRSPAGDFEAPYSAKVLPFFFYNETGRLTIRVPDEALRKLERGEAIEFSGRAVNHQNEERRVEGKATPTDTSNGKIKVRVFVSPKIELIFNTTYRFPPQ
jgi:hypothetical protein